MSVFPKLNNIKLKLPILIAYWILFTLSYFKGGVFNTYSFLYACIIYIPLTIFILLDKFQISIILILFVFVLDGIGALANGTVILANIKEAKFNHYITLVYSILVVIFVVYVAVLCVKRLKGEIGEDIYISVDMKYIYTVIGLALFKLVFMTYNLVVVIGNANELMNTLVSFGSSVLLFILEIIYLLSSVKKEYLLKSDTK